MGKGIGPLICLVLVVGVLTGTASAAPAKAVSEICGKTDYKEACEAVLSKVNNMDDPKEYIAAAIMAGAEAAQKAFNLSGDLIVKAEDSDDGMKMALEDCKDLLQDAVQELQASFSSVGDSQLHTMDQRIAELQNWLSAVISYQETCRDQFGEEDSEYKSAMSNGMVDARQLTSNALALVDTMSNILSNFGLQFGSFFPSANSRKLLSIDEDGFPSWFSSRSRNLLGRHRKNKLPPNVTVALDGSGQFKTIKEAIDACPEKNQHVFVIYVKTGIYKEYVIVDKQKTNIFMYGDGPYKTVISGDHNNRAGYKTMNSATFAALGNGFVAKSIGFENTAGPQGHQAVALRVQSDQSAFLHCWITGYQDTLYTQAHRQFYHNCTISGTIDFIFGDASVVIQDSTIVIRKPMDSQSNTVTAHGRSDRFETTGLVIQNCKIVAERQLVPFKAKIPSYLGRPWRAYSRTIIMESEIDDVIHPDGWLPWDGNLFLDTLYYAEYGNRGAGANTDKRVKWKGFHVLTNKKDALQFTAGPFLQANDWMNSTRGKFNLGMAQN